MGDMTNTHTGEPTTNHPLVGKRLQGVLTAAGRRVCIEVTAVEPRTGTVWGYRVNVRNPQRKSAIPRPYSYGSGHGSGYGTGSG